MWSVKRLMFCVLAVMLLCQIKVAECYGSGAPSGACATLKPSHGGSSTATGAPPYNISLSQSSYKPADVIQVTFSGLSGASFEGFLIVAKRSDGLTNDVIGTFTGLASNTKTVCATTLGNGVTHIDKNFKTSVSFNWTAPTTSQGDLIFRYAVVRASKLDYFENIPATTLSAVKATEFSKNPECGVSRGCFSDCQNKLCGWEVSWKKDIDRYNITIKSVVASDNSYFAFGFSDASAMNPASVVACLISNGNVAVNGSNNDGYANTPLPNPQEGIHNQQNSYSNGILECSFSKDTVSSDPKVFNLTETWFLITAKGLLSNGVLKRHQEAYQTNRRIDLSDNSTDYVYEILTTSGPTGSPGPSTTPAPGKTFPKDSDCGKNKGCYNNCKNNVCDLLLSWKQEGDKYLITFKSAFRERNNYLAFGLSSSPLMNPANVMSCSAYQSNVMVNVSKNKDYENTPLSNQLVGLSPITTDYSNGILSCSVYRNTTPSNTDVYSLAEKWHIIVARGVVNSDGSLKQHASTDRTSTQESVDFSDKSVDISLDEPDFTLVKTHGSLMVIAWMFVSSIGITMARFGKALWPEKTICSVKIWFAVHRAAMVGLFAIGVSSFIIIFVHIDGFSDIRGDTYQQAHPILGIVVTSLLVINPFMSLLRCAPNHPRRIYFNFAHRLVGFSAQILAVVTIGSGLFLAKANLHSWHGRIILIAFASWNVVFFTSMTILSYLADAKTNRQYDVNTNGGPDGSGGAVNYQAISKNKEPPFSSLKKVLFLAHVIVLLALTICMIYLIVNGDF